MTRSLRRPAFTLLFASVAWFAAQDAKPTLAPGPPGEAIEIGRRIALESKVLGETRHLRIALPASYESSKQPCSVLYLLDGDTLFAQAVGVTRHLGAFDAPPLIVVGIDNTERTRDLTPPATDAKTKSDFPSGGGSAAFRRFLVDEVRPFIESNYRTGERGVLAGHSFGGLFSAETMLVEPDAFDGYLVLSPSFWWDDESWVKRFEDAERDHGMFERFAWFAMGDEGAGMNPHFEAVTWSIDERSPSTFRWGKQHFPGHDHWAAALPSLNAGMRAYFEPIRTLGSDASTFAEVQSEFALVQREFGDAVRMTAGPIVRRVRTLAERGEFDAALAILGGSIETIKDEPLLHYVHGQVLADAERFDDSIAALEAAIVAFDGAPKHADAVRWLRQALDVSQRKKAAK